ncbi:hypothetical protein KUV26_01450 [Leisingera daeponensis]|uniref:Phage tail protein n=1 Tax=Leisingera daeponensis TaxID=405746 RepID=A0ABS7NA64_9RHOB|nr:hypothetical protein [Leisingera daeponensis]
MLGLGFSVTGAGVQGPASRPAVNGLIGWYSAKATGTITRGAGEEVISVANLVPGGAALGRLSGGGPVYVASAPVAGGRPALVWPDAANARGLTLASDALVREVFAVMAYADGARSAFDTYNTLTTDLAGLDSSSANRVMGHENNAGIFTASLPPGMTVHLNGGGATTSLLPMPLSVLHIKSASPFALASIGGRNNGSSRAWRGPVCEVLAYTDALDAAGVSRNVSYLKDGWGIS